MVNVKQATNMSYRRYECYAYIHTHAHMYALAYIHWQDIPGYGVKDETLTFGSQSVGDKAIRGWWRL